MARDYPVGRVEEFPEGTHRVVRAGNREVGVFNVSGEFHAIPNLCPHQRGPLCDGAVSGTLDYGPHTGWSLAWTYEGEVVTCPWHSLEFHIPTGRCLARPDIRLRKFRVNAHNGELRIIV